MSVKSGAKPYLLLAVLAYVIKGAKYKNIVYNLKNFTQVLVWIRLLINHPVVLVITRSGAIGQ